MSDWAAKYEALKKERMEKEQAKKNKNLGQSMRKSVISSVI